MWAILCPSGGVAWAGDWEAARVATPTTYHVVRPADVDADGDVDVVAVGGVTVGYAEGGALSFAWDDVYPGPASVAAVADDDDDGDPDVIFAGVDGVFRVEDEDGVYAP